MAGDVGVLDLAQLVLGLYLKAPDDVIESPGHSGQPQRRRSGSRRRERVYLARERARLSRREVPVRIEIASRDQDDDAVLHRTRLIPLVLLAGEPRLRACRVQAASEPSIAALRVASALPDPIPGRVRVHPGLLTRSDQRLAVGDQLDQLRVHALELA